MNTDIIEGNRLIAEFMGAGFPAIDKSVMAFILSEQRFPDNMYRCKVGELKYHSSWDWIIEPIKKFRALDIDNDTYRSHVQEIDNAVIDEYDIVQSFKALVNAIKWYNQYLLTK